MRGIRTLVWSIAALSAVGGALLWVLPPNTSAVALSPAIAPGGIALPQAAIDTLSAMEIALANVFDATRTPPTRRYLPPEFGTDSAAGMVEGSSPDAGSMSGQSDGLPRLYGTVLLPTGSKALLHLESSDLGPRLYSVGDRAAGYRIISISPRSVVLAASQGRLTLRLDNEEMRP